MIERYIINIIIIIVGVAIDVSSAVTSTSKPFTVFLSTTSHTSNFTTPLLLGTTTTSLLLGTATTPLLLDTTTNGKEAITVQSTRPYNEYSFTIDVTDNKHAIELYIGESCIIDCRITNTKKPPNIYWEKDGKPVQKVNYRFSYRTNLNASFVLEFNNVIVTDAGEYKCLVGDDGEQLISKTYYLKVNEIPEKQSLVAESILPKHVSAFTRQTVKFVCKTRGGNDIPKFCRWDHLIELRNITNEEAEKSFKTWLSPNQNLYKVKTVKVDQCLDQSILTLSDVTMDDGGLYLCIVSSKRGFVRMQTMLTVKPNQASIADGTHLSVIIPIVLLCVIIIGGFTAIYAKRLYKRRSFSRSAHSYHYTSATEE